MGTPDFAVPTLLEIIGSGHEVVAVYTRAPQPAGRGMALRPSPVAREAERFALPVFTPQALRDAEAAPAMRARGADAAVVVAYGLILPKAVLDAFSLGAFNLHASLLPRWRGAAPIHRAVMAGDAETGVMVMKMEEGLDTGPIAMAERAPIGPDATTGDLHDELKRRGASLMVRALAALEKGALQLTPQPASGVTYATRSARTKRTSIGAGRGTRSMIIVAACRPFPARGRNCPAPGASRFCARPRGPATVRRAVCSTTD